MSFGHFTKEYSAEMIQRLRIRREALDNQASDMFTMRRPRAPPSSPSSSISSLTSTVVDTSKCRFRVTTNDLAHAAAAVARTALDDKAATAAAAAANGGGRDNCRRHIRNRHAGARPPTPPPPMIKTFQPTTFPKKAGAKADLVARQERRNLRMRASMRLATEAAIRRTAGRGYWSDEDDQDDEDGEEVRANAKDEEKTETCGMKTLSCFVEYCGCTIT